METEYSNPARIEEQLTPLRELIINKPPYVSGTLGLPASFFSLFYRTTKDSHNSRHINLANATFDELEQLALACKSTPFAMSEERLLGMPGKMVPGCFAPLLVPVQTNLVKIIRDYYFEGDMTTQGLRIELRELNVDSKGSFSSVRVEPLPGKRRLGSLAIIFPTLHDGGALSLRSGNHEWSIYPSREIAAVMDAPSVDYVVLLKDVEHEVTPIISGHRVTLTYDLYTEADDGGALLVPANDQVLNPFCPLANERAFHDAFSALLENPEFLPEGGTLGFGLRHVYPNDEKLSNIYAMLKGIDAVVYRSARALGFEPVLYLYYELDGDLPEGGLIQYPLDLDCSPRDSFDILRLLRSEGGTIVCKHLEWHRASLHFQAKAEKIEWATPKTTFNSRQSRYAANNSGELSLETVSGDICLVVRIGKASERLTYPTVAQLEKEWKVVDDEIQLASNVRDEISSRSLAR